jgi:hypothetical protein|tara:strand:+ start:10749 stop:11351 length:603 start_codon:yes stop_codon:yes gene_type:complete
MAVSAVVGIIGQMSAAKAQRRQAAVRQQQMRLQQQQMQNAQIALDQTAQAEKDNERVRQALIGDEGARALGEHTVLMAAHGLITTEGSPLDLSKKIAGDVAYDKLWSRYRSDNELRNIAINRANIGANIDTLGLESRELGIATAAKTQAATLGSFNIALAAGAGAVKGKSWGDLTSGFSTSTPPGGTGTPATGEAYIFTG